MIMQSKHNKYLLKFFSFYTYWILKINFRNVFIKGSIEHSQKPTLVISNHISWWDGFWIFHFNKIILKKKFHFMMLEKQLKKFWFFNYTGGFSIRKNSKSIIESIDYTMKLLKKKENMVLIFPQGKINSIYNHEIKFETGIKKILTNVNSNVQLIFIASLVDYFSHPKPELSIYTKEFKWKEDADIENEYQQFYKTCVEEQKRSFE